MARYGRRQEAREQRLRDPVHGLIVFSDDGFEQLIWRLVNTREFQRLRRIKQLGFSELVYPGATHTRFAHSIGVFHTARNLVAKLQRLLGCTFDRNRARVAVCAALLHDIGHGPFSHTFEGVMRDHGSKKKHEQWTAEIIRGDTEVHDTLRSYDPELVDNVASLLAQEYPTDIYASIVSSQFDADRLDYLRRDKLMTGTEHGGFDWSWLLNNLQVVPLSIASEDDTRWHTIDALALGSKGLPAAEAYLLGRYHLYTQVYLHKTTRAAEKMLGKLLGRIASLMAQEHNHAATGLPKEHPLTVFLRPNGDTLANYLALDDAVMWGGLQLMECATDTVVRELAYGLRNRKLYKCRDIAAYAYRSGAMARFRKNLNDARRARLFADVDIIEDRTKVSAYKVSDYESPTALSQINICRADGSGDYENIADLSSVVKPICDGTDIFRVYGRNNDCIGKIDDLLQKAVQ